jgi:hypothetical protein
VTADGAAPLSYQWFCNGTPVPDANAATLKLIHVSTNMAGDYSVTVSNAFGVVTSGSAGLKFIEATLPPPSNLRITP